MLRAVAARAVRAIFAADHLHVRRERRLPIGRVRGLNLRDVARAPLFFLARAQPGREQDVERERVVIFERARDLKYRAPERQAHDRFAHALGHLGRVGEQREEVGALEHEHLGVRHREHRPRVLERRVVEDEVLAPALAMRHDRAHARADAAQHNEEVRTRVQDDLLRHVKPAAHQAAEVDDKSARRVAQVLDPVEPPRLLRLALDHEARAAIRAGRTPFFSTQVLARESDSLY